MLSADTVVGNSISECLTSLGASFTQLESALKKGGELDLAVIVPGEASATERSKRLGALRDALRSLSSRRLDQLILVSSGAIYGPDHHKIGFVSEDAKRRPAILNHLADWWDEVEAVVRDETANSDVKLLVIRCPFIVDGNGTSYLDRVFKRRWLVRYAGFNPPLQFVSVSGLGNAIRHAFEIRLSGTYHLAPTDVVPLRAMLQSKGVRSIGVPRVVQRFLRPILLRFLDGVRTTDEVDYLRYPWTLSGHRFAAETGLRLSSRQALADSGAEIPDDWPKFDRFGADEAFVRRQGAATFRFAEKVFWRIESKGFEHIPNTGGAIIVGPHRGFMPLDAVMIFHLIYQYAGRIPRFLTHPTLFKFPFQAHFFHRMACVMACRENAERVLESGELLGVYPEGIRGAFKMYRDAYVFGRFGRADYVHWALRFNVPVIPFAIIGSAEIFPIIGKIKWGWLKKYFEWPFFPITPTFPLILLPLPTKWHVKFLPPVHPSDIKKRAKDTGKDPAALFAESVRTEIDRATQELLAQRRSIFWGRIW